MKAITVGELRAALDGYEDNRPIMLDGDGALEDVREGEAGAAESGAGGFVDDADTVPALWLLGHSAVE